ncbi:MAG: Nre family DNA repair protein [Thermoproteota archaeon]|nr:hypothetical protein [Candidatus Brockarchaeota archaeon]MBO3768203.1 hypothetical protein [Candidatus Brockarchaeota archaeon]MBO3801649.1 hypothetical protein [Candidatus Brockarchaeota archaeon]
MLQQKLYSNSSERKQREVNICLLCRGTKLLCGKPACPILVRTSSITRLEIANKKEIFGSSPPSVFVGRFGYPKVMVGPMVPPFQGDTSYLSKFDYWYSEQIEEYVQKVTSLVRGMYPVRADKLPENYNFLLNLHDLVLSSKPVDTRMDFKGKIISKVYLSEDVQPFGPYGYLERMEYNPSSSDKVIEKVYYDKDLKATEAIWKLYEQKRNLYTIQQVFSLGMLGSKNRRKVVPTRWSITAVDDSLAKFLMRKIRDFPSIDEYRVFFSRSMGNVFSVILMPGNWSYEFIEIFHKGSVWNTWSETPAIASDFEGPNGRTTYASIGGCYYASRFAVLEYFSKIRRSGGAIVVREALPSYYIPVGVWIVREGVRKALQDNFKSFSTLEDALKETFSKMKASLNDVLLNSNLLKSLKKQRKLKISY